MRRRKKGKMSQKLPPYAIYCPDGTILRGDYKVDRRTGEQVLDDIGNYVDSVTNKPVICGDGL